MPTDLRQAGHAIHMYVRNGTPPAPAPGRWLKIWADDLRGQEKGGSGNHGWIGWLIEYMRGSESARLYLVQRLRWELAHGLMAHEQFPWSYGTHHAAPVLIVYWIAWSRGDEELSQLAGAWVERWLLLSCLCGHRDQDGILQILAPGMRRDKGDRWNEEALVSYLLGLPHPAQVPRESQRPWTVGSLIGAVREAGGIERVADRARPICLEWLRHKDLRLVHLERVRLMVPMRFHRWPSGDWFAWIPKGGGQDPPCPGAGVVAGRVVEFWPFKDNPPEEGWRAEVLMAPDRETVHARWWWKGTPFGRQSEDLPPGPPPEIIGSPSGPDPLADLPPAPDPREWPGRQGGGPRPRPEPEPEPEEPDTTLPEDPKTIEWGHVTAKPRRTLVLLRRVTQAARTGRWKGVEREAAKWWEEVRDG